MVKDLGRIVTGHTPPTKEKKFYGDFMPFIKPTDISKDEKYTYNPEQYYSKEAAEKYKSSLIPKGATCVVCIGTIGEKMTMAHCDLFTNQSINSIIPSNDYDPDFVYYLLKYNLSKVKSLNKGTASGREFVSKSTFLEMPIMVCEYKDEQIRIGSILSRYDSLIENYQRQIKLLEEAAQRLYKEWFVDLHFPGYENTKIVDGVPEGWKRKTLDDVTSKFATGLNPRKNFVLGRGYNYYVTIKNMATNDVFLDDKCDKVDNEALKKINNRSDLQIGDLLFSGIGTIGRVYLISIPTSNWNISESVFTLRANELISKEFLYLLLLSDDLQGYCQMRAHGAAQKGIRMSDLKAYTFLYPSKSVRTKFDSKVSSLIHRAANLKKQLRLLTEARDRLLPKLMSGEIEV